MHFAAAAALDTFPPGMHAVQKTLAWCQVEVKDLASPGGSEHPCPVQPRGSLMLSAAHISCAVLTAGILRTCISNSTSSHLLFQEA